MMMMTDDDIYIYIYCLSVCVPACVRVQTGICCIIGEQVGHRYYTGVGMCTIHVVVRGR